LRIRRSFGFDSNGNRLSRVTPEGSVSGTYDAQDRMLSYGPCTWSYDGHGDTQGRTCSANRASAAEARFPAGETRYRYDVFSNLRRVETLNVKLDWSGSLRVSGYAVLTRPTVRRLLSPGGIA
jgi:hypothetical protein